MKKITLSILCVLTLIVSVQGQTVVGHYDFATPQAPFDSGFLPRGVHVEASGEVLIWGKTLGFPSYIGFFKLDQNHQVGWVRVHAEETEDIKSSVVSFDSLWVFSADYGDDPQNDQGQIILMRKESGEVVRRIRMEGRLGGLCKATDTTFLVVGRIKNPSFYSPGFNHFRYDGFVVEMNIWGDTLWTSRVGVSNRADDLLEVAKTETGYVTVGTVVPGSTSFPPTNNTDAQVVLIDDSGAILVGKQFDLQAAHPSTVFATDLPVGVVASDTTIYTCYALVGTISHRGSVVAMNASGSWVRIFSFGYGPTSNVDATPYSIVRGVDDGVVVVGSTHNGSFVMKLDDTLGVEWTRRIPGFAAHNIAHNNHGDGYVIVANPSFSQPGFRIVHMDALGNAGGLFCDNDTIVFTYQDRQSGVTLTPNVLRGDYPYEGVELTSAGSFATLLNLADSCLSFDVLTIELLDFSAKVEGERVLLEWVTASEQDNDYFEVLRGRDPWSIDEVVARVDGAGTSQETVRYQLYDDEPLVGTSYYQLRQVDYDLSSAYSKVLSVSFDRHGMVWPNPTCDLVYGLPRSMNVLVYDMTGRLVKRFVRSDGPINLSELVTGTYLLQMDDGRKHIIQKE